MYGLIPKAIYEIVRNPPPNRPPNELHTMSIIRVQSRHHKGVTVTLAGGHHNIYFNRDGIAECPISAKEDLYREMRCRPNRFEILADETQSQAVADLLPTINVFGPEQEPVNEDLSAQEATADDIQELDEPDAPAEELAPTPKKRGRPPKPRGNDNPPPAPKKRGRPPKQKPIIDDASPKKRRGRPPKNKTS